MRYISLCSGVEAASMAWLPLGWEPVAYAEIDQYPSAVLAARFPETPNLGDITKVDWKEYRGTADLVVAGFPCQSYSISGLRKGLDDPRGQIMLESLAAIRDIDPEWAILENVPGLLSADRGRCFETLLSAVAILWPRGGIAWRILDAQWFGVPQRRRRVFAVINTRDWRRAAAVLLDENCLRGNPPSREQARKAAAADAPGGAGETGGDGCLTPWDVQSRRVFTKESTRPALYAGEDDGHGYAASEDDPIAFKWFAGAKARTMPAYDDGTTPTLTNSDSHQPAIAFAQNQRDEVRLINGDGDIAGSVSSIQGSKQTTCVAITQYGTEIAGTLTARHDSSPCSDRGQNVVVIADDNAHAAIDEDMSGTLKNGGSAPILCMASGQAHAEISMGGGGSHPRGEELQGPADHLHRGGRSDEPQPMTSNGSDLFPSLCAIDGDKQFIDNQSIDGGRLLLVPPANHIKEQS